MKNIDILEQDKKRFVISKSKWIRFSDITDWDIFDPNRIYAIKEENDEWPIFIKIDSPVGKLISSEDLFNGMDFDEWSYRFSDDYFIKEFDIN
jgi:hypothetical protein